MTTEPTQYTEAPEGYEGKMRWMNWNGINIKVGNGFSPRFFNILQARKKAGKSIVALVTGAPGDGKTWIALRLAELLDPKFKIIDAPAPPPTEDTSQVCFDRQCLMNLIGENTPLKRGQALVIDEANFQFSSRRFFEEDQKGLMEIFSAVRSKGLIIFVVVLHSSMIDVVVRKHVVGFQLHISNRGVADVYELFTPKFEDTLYHPSLGKIRLQVPGFEECDDPNCLKCPNLKGVNAPKCYNLRAKYERRKAEAIAKKSAKVSDHIDQKENEEKTVSDDDHIKTWIDHQDEWGWSKRGLPSISDLQALSEKYLLKKPGRGSTVNLKDRMLKLYPALKPPAVVKKPVEESR